MNHPVALHVRLCIFTLLALFSATPAIADRPSHAENGKENKHEKKAGKHQKEHRSDDRREEGKARFDDDNRRIVNEYYGEKFRTGKCPPGLAKKNNGCLPPGQTRKWAIGQPLPTDLRHYNLPKDLQVRLPAPPAGHRYVRIASDILLVAVGTSMVVDAIEDIGRQTQ